MPPGDPHEAYRDYQLPRSELPISRVHLRVDWQTLRRLPLSGAIIFNFKALFTPLEQFRKYVLDPPPLWPSSFFFFHLPHKLFSFFHHSPPQKFFLFHAFINSN